MLNTKTRRSTTWALVLPVAFMLVSARASGEISPDLRAFIEGMPKTALHMHLEGSFEPELAFKIAKRNGIKPGSKAFPWKTVKDLKDAYHFDNLESFLKVYNKVAKVLTTEQDFHDLAEAYCTKAISENIRHAEVFFDPQTHTSRGIPFKTVVDGFNRAFGEARLKGMSIRLIASFLRDHPVGNSSDSARVNQGFPNVEKATAWATAKQIVGYNQSLPESSRDRIIGIGLDNQELGYPPTLFADIYAFSLGHGLLTTAHAGEEGPPAYIWEAIRDAQCARIDHCVRCTEDPTLLAYLARPHDSRSIEAAYGGPHRIPITVCPLSNYKLKVFKDSSETNIVEILDLGVQATVNSDDPAYFGGYVTENYVFLLEALAPGKAKARPINISDVYRLCVNGFEASWITAAEKGRYLKEVDDYFIVRPGLLYEKVVRKY